MGIKVHDNSSLEFDHRDEGKYHTSEWYNGSKNYDVDRIDKDLNKIFDDPNVKAVQVITEIYDPNTQATSYISKVIDPERFFNLQEIDASVADLLGDDLDQDQYKGSSFVAGGVTVRVMY